MTPKISAVINTFNEAANIVDCLASIGGFADEIVVCDMHSDDGTADLARQHGARVVLVDPMPGQYQKLRHAAITHAQHEWILQIDADERMTDRLKTAIRTALADETLEVVTMRILFWYFGGWVRHGIFYGDPYPRVFRKSVFLAHYAEQSCQVHRDWAALDKADRRVDLPPDVCLLHLAYPTIEKYVSKTVGMYARMEGEQWHREGVRFSAFRMFAEPARVFVRSYLRKRGYRDGMRGLILSLLFAMYRFNTWANLWLQEEWARGRPALPDPGRDNPQGATPKP